MTILINIELHEMIKQKADGEEFDSLSNLINDLYDKIQEIEKNGGSGMGGVSSNGGQTSAERTPIMPRSSVASQSRAGVQTVKEINETLRVMKDRIDAMAG